MASDLTYRAASFLKDFNRWFPVMYIEQSAFFKVSTDGFKSSQEFNRWFPVSYIEQPVFSRNLKDGFLFCIQRASYLKDFNRWFLIMRTKTSDSCLS